MSVRMKPYQDADGNLAPDRDYRPVPASVMAKYLGIHVTTLWRRVSNGSIPSNAMQMIGTVRHFKPRKVLGIEQ